MKYKNVKTGVVIETTSKIISKNWVPEGKQTVEKKFDKLTKTELFEILESQNIPYKPKQTKKELIALLEGD